MTTAEKRACVLAALERIEAAELRYRVMQAAPTSTIESRNGARNAYTRAACDFADQWRNVRDVLADTASAADYERGIREPLERQLVTLREALEALYDVAYHYGPSPGHLGLCTPESQCDGECAEVEEYNYTLRRAREALANTDIGPCYCCRTGGCSDSCRCKNAAALAVEQPVVVEDNSEGEA